jgi:hypothetical protein
MVQPKSLKRERQRSIFSGNRTWDRLVNGSTQLATRLRGRAVEGVGEPGVPGGAMKMTGWDDATGCVAAGDFCDGHAHIMPGCCRTRVVWMLDAHDKMC